MKSSLSSARFWDLQCDWSIGYWQKPHTVLFNVGDSDNHTARTGKWMFAMFHCNTLVSYPIYKFN